MLLTLQRWLRWTCGLLAAVCLFTLMGLTLFDVLGRKFFHNSIPGSLELSEVLMVIVIFGALPLVSWRGEHVTFDSLDEFLPDWFQAWQSRLVHLISGVLFGVLSWLLTVRADRFAEYGDITEFWHIPLSPVAMTMAVLLGLTAAVHLYFVFDPKAEGGADRRAPWEREEPQP